MFRQLSENAEVAVNKATATYAIEIITEVVRETPVDVGTARSNWRVSLGKPLTATVKAFNPYASRWRKPYGPGGNKGESANANAAINLAKMRLNQYKGGSIKIVNGVPYINRLNRGYSKQSGSGWIQKAIRNADARLRTKIKKILEENI